MLLFPLLLLLLLLGRGLGGRALGLTDLFVDDISRNDKDVDLPLAKVKRWLPNGLFSNPDNWEGGSLPCAGDRVLFPRSLGLAPVYVAAGRMKGPSVEVREIVLPWNGEVVLPLAGRLVVGGEESRSRGCPGKDVRWRVSATPTWLDPANWTPAEAPRDPKDLAATPHLERVPCGQDVAAFADSAFQTMLPDFPVRVAAVKVYDALFTGSQAWLMSVVLGEEFRMAPGRSIRSGALQVMAQGPGDIAGQPPQCGLGTHQGDDSGADVQRMANEELEQGVCQHVTCAVPACGQPVRPHLHCCLECGAVLELRPLPAEADAAVAEVRRVALAEALRFESRWGAAAGPAVHVGAVPAEGLVQVVLLGDYGQDLADMVLARVLERKGGWPGLKASVRASGAPMAPATAGSILAVLLGSLVLVLVALAALVYSQDRTLSVSATLSSLLGGKQSAFLFARFENAAGDEGGGGAVRVVSRQQQQQGVPGVRSARGSWSSRSFRNPLYGQEEQHPPLGLPLQSPQQAPRGVAHENPLFSELKERLEINHGEADANDPKGPEAVVEEAEAKEGPLVDITL